MLLLEVMRIEKIAAGGMRGLVDFYSCTWH